MRAPRSFLFTTTLGFALLLGIIPAQAQRGPMDDPHFAIKLLLGLGGEVELESVEDDLELSYGLGFEYMYPLHDYFALGGAIGLQSWQTEGGEDADLDRNLLFDLTLMPQLKFAVADSIELYATVPLGVSFDSIGENEVTVGGVGGEVDTAIGFTTGILLGARFGLSDSVGLLAELGYLIHSYEHEVTATAGPLGSASVDFDLDLAQIAFNAGVYF